MRLLVDTHSFLWALAADNRLSDEARHMLGSRHNELFFSLASLWEIGIKIKTGKLGAVGSSVSYVRDEMESYGMQLLPIRYEHVLQFETLPMLHGDPFDRLLIAQSLAEGLPVITKDKQFKAYGVKTIW